MNFELNEIVTIGKSEISGKIIGRAEYLYMDENQYLVRYIDKDGFPQETWYVESSLS